MSLDSLPLDIVVGTHHMLIQMEFHVSVVLLVLLLSYYVLVHFNVMLAFTAVASLLNVTSTVSKATTVFKPLAAVLAGVLVSAKASKLVTLVPLIFTLAVIVPLFVVSISRLSG